MNYRPTYTRQQSQSGDSQVVILKYLFVQEHTTVLKFRSC